MLLKNLLKIIPLKYLLTIVWEILDPILQKRVNDTKSAIDDKVYQEIKTIIEKLIGGLNV